MQFTVLNQLAPLTSFKSNGFICFFGEFKMGIYMNDNTVKTTAANYLDVCKMTNDKV